MKSSEPGSRSAKCVMSIRTVENAGNLSGYILLVIARLGNSGKTQVAHEICRARINSVGRLRSRRWLRENEVKGVK